MVEAFVMAVFLCTGLRKLSLRQNVLTSADSLSQCAFAPGEQFWPVSAAGGNCPMVPDSVADSCCTVLQELILQDNHLSQVCPRCQHVGSISSAKAR